MPRRILTIAIIMSMTASLSALSVGLGSVGSAWIGAGDGLNPRMQYGIGGSLDLCIPVLPWLDLRTEMDLFDVFESDARLGYLYRGFGGGALAAGAAARGTLASLPGIGSFDAGGGLGMAGAFVGTKYTTLYWFYPEVRLEGFLGFRPRFLPSLRFELRAPLGWQLRKDMDYSFSAGLGLRVSLSFGEEP
jgi:hypothetical protein